MKKIPAETSYIDQVVRLLKQGGVIIYPTETVYGLGALADQPAAIDRIASIKGSDSKARFLILIRSRESMAQYAKRVPPLAEELADRFWPGPLTLILPACDGLHPRLVGPSGGIAMRVSSHPWCRDLMNELGSALVSTSANLSGRAEPTSADELNDRIVRQVDLIMGGGRLVGKPSTIVDLCLDPPLIRRSGAVDKSFIEQILDSGGSTQARSDAIMTRVK